MKANTKIVIPLVVTLFLSLGVFGEEGVSSTSPAGTIERATKQQLLASIPPSPTDTGSSQLFLTSPSGKYAAFLLRRKTSIDAGGFGSDFCYIQVQDSGVSMWESECTVVSNVNTCSLVFSEAGLEIFDGSRSAWDTDVPDDDAHLQAMELMDRGDLQIRNKDGDLTWKASDSPMVNQNCGSLGAPGLSPAHPPFGSPIHDDGKGPFGQDINNNQGQQPQPAAGVQLGFPQPQPQPQLQQTLDNPNQPFSSLNQPLGASFQQLLVDNTPFDSGSPRVILQLGLLSALVLMPYFAFLF